MATRRTRFIERTAVVAAAVCVASAAAPMLSTYAETGSGTAGVTLAPARTTSGVAASRSYIVRGVRAGHGYRDAVLVTNVGSSAVTLDVTSVRATTATTTGVVYANADTGDARWVQPELSTVRVPAHATISVPFSVRVPSDALPGNHLSGIAFTNPNAVVNTQGQLSVRTLYRNVMAVQTNVTGPAAAHFSLKSASLQAATGTGLATLSLRVVNDGRLFDHGRLTLGLAGPGYTRTVARMTGLFLAGDTIDLPTLWPTNLEPGRYSLTATLKGTDFPTATLHATVTLSDRALGGATAPVRPFLTTTAPSAVHNSASSKVAMLSALAAAVLIGATAAGWIVTARRRRRDEPAATADTPDRELLGV